MNKDSEVSIQKVANGWIVRPYSFEPKPYMVSNDEVYVFNSFVKMIEWLDIHFTKVEKVE